MKCLDNSFTKVFKDKSGICHHMIFETKYVKEIIEIVEKNHNDLFYNIFLKNIHLNHIKNSGASEYEIYFNYIFKYHEDDVKLRRLNWKNTNVLNEEVLTDTEFNFVHIITMREKHELLFYKNIIKLLKIYISIFNL